MKVKADEKLFRRFQFLGAKLSQMGSIVQNDIDIPYSQLEEFDSGMRAIIAEINLLINDTEHHIQEPNYADGWLD